MQHVMADVIEVSGKAESPTDGGGLVATSEPAMELQSLTPHATDEDEEPVKARSNLRLVAVMTALYLSLFIAALDQTIIATAVPTIASDLESSSGYVWIMSAYLLANAGAGPIWAKISDIWGRKAVLLLAVAIFFGSSVICAEAGSMKMLIAGRSLQGVAGGGLLQLVLITISDIFSVRSRSLYLGLTEVMWAIAGGSGPILGGAFTQLLSWRWCFWINLPIAGATFILLLVFLDVHNPRTEFMTGLRAIDWFGSLSIIGLTLMLLLGLEFGGATFPWKSPQVLCLIIFGCAMSLVFIYSEQRLAKYPLMPLRLFRSRSNIACFAVGFFHGMVFIAGEYYLPLYFQSVYSASPLQSGLMTIALPITEAVMGIISGVAIHQTGNYTIITYIGVVLLTIGVGLYTSFGTSTSIATIVGFEIIAGVGAGALFESPLLALQAHVSQDDTAVATSTLGFVRNLATSFSIVIGGVVFQNTFDASIPQLTASGVPSSITDLLVGGSAAANVDIVASIANEAWREAVREVFVLGLRNMWILYTCVSFCALISAVFIAEKRLSWDHVETRTGLKEKVEEGVIVQ